MSETTNQTYVTAEWIRRPVHDLGGKSPADAAADPAGRRKLDDLLTELAGHYVRLTSLGLPAVDPAEIRKALGIAAPALHAPSRPHLRPVRQGPVKRNVLLDELGTALTGGDVDSVSFFNLKSGAIEHFMHNLGDQETARIAEAETNPELKKVTPVTTEVRYGIMSDFISTVEDINVAGKLRTTISGKGAFRRFRESVDEDDALRRRWLAYRTKRHYHLALDWLHKHALDPDQYQIKVSDYDWQPPIELAESEAAPTPEVAPDQTQNAALEAQAPPPLPPTAEPEAAVAEPAMVEPAPEPAAPEPTPEPAPPEPTLAQEEPKPVEEATPTST